MSADHAHQGFAKVAVDSGQKRAQAVTLTKQSAEFENAILTAPSKRTGPQVSKVAHFLSSIEYIEKLSVSNLSSFVHKIVGMELYMGQTIYRAGDSPDQFYVVVQGQVTLYDARDKDNGEESDPVVETVGARDWFGQEEMLCGARRVFTAAASENGTLLLRCPADEYKKALEDQHMEGFDAKVDFLASLAPLKPLRPEVVRKLAPCFQMIKFNARDVVVRQGEKADAMYAIKGGTCAVIVDPHYQEAKADEGKLGELDPKKTLQVVTLDSGAIIGDITVLASVKRRTASVIATSEMLTYKIRRAVFLRRLPPDQLEVLRRLATEKLKLTNKKVNSRPAAKGLMDKILHGHNLRELFNQHTRAQGGAEGQPEEYLQLIHLLRRYKRSAVPPPSPSTAHLASSVRAALPSMLVLTHGPASAPASPSGFSGGGVGFSAVSATGAVSEGHPDWGVAGGGGAGVGGGGAYRATGSARSGARGSASVAAAIARAFPVPPGGTYPLGEDGGLGLHGHGGNGNGSGGVSPGTWRPLSPRRAVSPGSPGGGPFNYHSRPFVSSMTLKTLMQEGGGPASAPATPMASHPAPSPFHQTAVSHGSVGSMASAHAPGSYGSLTVTIPPSGASGGFGNGSGGFSGGPAGHGLPPSLVLSPFAGQTAAGVSPPPGVSPSVAFPGGFSPGSSSPNQRPKSSGAVHGGRSQGGAGLRPTTPSNSWTSTNLALPNISRGMLATPGGLGRFLTQLDLHSDMGELGGSGYATVPGQGDGVYGRTDSGLSQGAGAAGLESALDKLASPLMDARARPALRRGTAHYRPTIPKALL